MEFVGLNEIRKKIKQGPMLRRSSGQSTPKRYTDVTPTSSIGSFQSFYNIGGSTTTSN